MGFAGGKIEKVPCSSKVVGSCTYCLQLPLNLVLLKNIEITGIHWGAYTGAYSSPFKNGNTENTHVFLSQGIRIPTFRVQSGYSVSSRVYFHTSSSFHPNPSLLQSGKATPVVYPEVYPLERLADGLVALENRRTWGKVIVRVRDEPSPTTKL